MDSNFIQKNSLLLNSVPPIRLSLFDSTSNSIITQSLELPVQFPSGESTTLSLFVTPLDPSCSLVLGYNWLTCYNPLIDWVLGSIKFCSQLLDSLCLSLSTLSARSAQLPPQKPSENIASEPVPSISFINAAAFAHACNLPGVQSFRIHLSKTSIYGKVTSVSNEKLDLSNIPGEYHDFADVFSKIKADTLAPYHLYNLKINLEGTSPPVGPLYSLSQSELKAL